MIQISANYKAMTSIEKEKFQKTLYFYTTLMIPLETPKTIS